MRRFHLKRGFLNTIQAAARLGVHPGTLGNWRRTKKGPKFSRLGDYKTAPIVYRIRDIMDFKKKQGR